MSMRRDAIYSTTIVGKPPMEDFYLGKATERIFLPLVRMSVPDLVDMNMPLEGVFHNCTSSRCKKRYPGHAKKLMNAIWGLGLLSLSRASSSSTTTWTCRTSPTWPSGRSRTWTWAGTCS